MKAPEGRPVERLLTVGEFADLLRVPNSWVYEQLRVRTTNRLPAFKVGKYWRFRESDVMAWLEQQRSKACAD